MLRYIVRRLLLMFLVLFGVMIFVFAVSRATGDPIVAMFGDGGFTKEQYDQLYHEYGFDRPQIVQFFDYVWDVLHGDLGTSYATRTKIFDDVMFRFPDSIRIAVFSLLWSIPIGILVGLVAAVKQYSALDYTLTTFAMISSALPSFWTALMLMLIFSLGLKLVPATGLETWKGYILPCIALGLHPMAHTARLTRSTMLEVIRQDYIRTARSKGLTERVVLFKHALQNASIPIVTQVGGNFANIVGGAVVVENIYLIPGLGNYLSEAIMSRDFPAVQGTVLMFAIFVSLVNLLIDIIYAILDPRIKAKYSSTISIKQKFINWKNAREMRGAA